MTKNLRLTSYIKRIIDNPLFAGGMIMLVGANLASLGQFIYHIIAGRLLGKVYYGDIAAIFSILGLVAVVQMSLGLTIVRFVAAAKSQSGIANFTKWVHRWSLWVGVGIGIITLFLSPLLANFMNLQQPVAIYFLGPSIVFIIMINATRSVLQGILKFGKYVKSLLVETWLRLFLTIVFILLGWSVLGAAFAIFLGTALAFFFTRSSISNYLRGEKGERPNIAPLLKYSVPVLLQGFALTSMYSTDVVLVKHFFSPGDAGIYASLAILGRIVFYGTSPLTQAMFPLIAQRHSHGKPYHNIFYLSFLAVLGIAVIIVLFYLLFPRLAVNILFGPEFISGAPYLWWFGLLMGLLAVATLLVQFYLSIGKTKIVGLFVLAALSQAILIWFIHPTILRVVQISVILATLLVISLLVYFPYHHSISPRGLSGTSNK